MPLHMQRLNKIADMVKFDTVVDIGTDHGYLPIILAQRGQVGSALATDLNAQPLGRARENIAKSGLGGVIGTLHCNGLGKVPEGAFATCVIAGLGGNTIMEILRSSRQTAKSFKQLILAPQRDVPDVRWFLHVEGFRIDDEDMAEENGKFYHILDCSIGQEPVYDRAGYLLGKTLINKRPATFVKYLSQELKKTTQIVKMLKAGCEQQRDMEKYAIMIRSVLEG